MAAPIPLLSNYDRAVLRRLAKASSDADQSRYLLALGVIGDGGRRVAGIHLFDSTGGATINGALLRDPNSDNVLPTGNPFRNAGSLYSWNFTADATKLDRNNVNN